MNTAAQFQILRHDIENVAEFSNKSVEREEIDIKIKDIINKQNKIIRNIKSINIIFSMPSLIEIILNSLMVCVFLIQFMVNMMIFNYLN